MKYAIIIKEINYLMPEKKSDIPNYIEALINNKWQRFVLWEFFKYLQELPEKPVCHCNIVFDMCNMGLVEMDYLKVKKNKKERFKMKQVIDRKIYDTETAELIHKWDNGCYGNDFKAIEEALYKTKKGAYFIAGSGGPLTSYAVSSGTNSTSGSSSIRVVSKGGAIEWLEEHDGADAIVEHFADSIEEG